LPEKRKDKLEKAKDMCYQLMGWDERGVPTRDRLVQIGCPDMADEMGKRGILKKNSNNRHPVAILRRIR